MGLKTNDGIENRASMNSVTEAIPCKNKDQKRRSGSPAAASSAMCGGHTNNNTKGGGYALCKK